MRYRHLPHETKNSLEVGVFRPVDDRVDGAVEDDNQFQTMGRLVRLVVSKRAAA